MQDITELDGPQFIDELANVPVMSMDDFISKYVDDGIIECENESTDEVDAIDFEENNTGRNGKLKQFFK